MSSGPAVIKGKLVFDDAASATIEKAKAGAILVDLSSVLPSTPKKIEAAAKARGLRFLEAPVSGGVTGARAATLTIDGGGTRFGL